MTDYKLLVCGPVGVGKSACTLQFVQNIFVPIYNPTVEDSYRKLVTIDDKPCILDILDTAGVEDFSAVRQHYMRTGQGFLIVYSIISNLSFEEMDKFREEILQVKDKDDVPIVIVGNKTDLEHLRQVSTQDGQSYAKRHRIPFFEVSAKTRVNVEEAFTEVVRQIRKYDEVNSPRKPEMQKENSRKKMAMMMGKKYKELCQIM